MATASGTLHRPRDTAHCSLLTSSPITARTACTAPSQHHSFTFTPSRCPTPEPLSLVLARLCQPAYLLPSRHSALVLCAFLAHTHTHTGGQVSRQAATQTSHCTQRWEPAPTNLTHQRSARMPSSASLRRRRHGRGGLPPHRQTHYRLRSTTKPRSYVVTHDALGKMELLEHIMLMLSYQSRTAVATCLRVNRHFFAAAGRTLYRIPPVIAAHNIVNFFSGALNAEQARELDCDGLVCPRPYDLDPVHSVSTLNLGSPVTREQPPLSGLIEITSQPSSLVTHEGPSPPAGVEIEAEVIQSSASSTLHSTPGTSPDSSAPITGSSAPVTASPDPVAGPSTGGQDLQRITTGAEQPAERTRGKKKPSPSTARYKKEKKKRGKKEKGKDKSRGERLSSSALRPGSPLGNLPTSSPGEKVNFKRWLLERVRVFSLGTHHACICGHYGPWRLLPKVMVFRIIQGIAGPHTLREICDREDGTCSLLSNIDCRKLVLRNNDMWGLRIPGDPSWDIQSLEEVVWFMPLNQKCMEAEDGTSVLLALDHDVQQRFRNATSVKLVLHDQWEPTPLPPRMSFQALGDVEPSSLPPVQGLSTTESLATMTTGYPTTAPEVYDSSSDADGPPVLCTDTFMFLCQSFFDWEIPPHRALVVGLERVQWDPWGDLTDLWKRKKEEEEKKNRGTLRPPPQEPREPTLDELKKEQEVLAELVRNEVTHGTLVQEFDERQLKSPRHKSLVEEQGISPKGVTNYPRNVTFIDWDTYLAGLGDRRGELNAEDEAQWTP